MNRVTVLAGMAPACAISVAAAEAPQFTRDNKLIRPADYREWIYLTSGLGMSYGPNAGESATPPFDNVFVKPSSYRAFLQTGKWPDRTIFILEIRSSTGHGSINRAGHFQTDLVEVEAAVKDEARFPEKWAYFSLGGMGTLRPSGKAFPKEQCYSCHSKNAAVENTFVQFYPTLLEVAEAKGTLNAGYPRSVATPGKFFAMIRDNGWSAAEIALRDAKSKDPEALIFQEASLNRLAYQLAAAGKQADAVSVLQYAIRSYPASANLYDSLAETYEAQGRKDLALKAARKCLELLPAYQASSDRKSQIEKAAKERIGRLSS